MQGPPHGAPAKFASAIAISSDMRTITLVNVETILGNQLQAKRRSEDSVGARRMPWRRKPKKGAASRDSPGGGAHGLRSQGARMGEPGGGSAPPPAAESIGCEEATRGTETSKYPEEEKSTEIALVAASERARCLNHCMCQAWGRWDVGVAGGDVRGAPAPGHGDKPERSRTAWEGRRHRVRAPYAKHAPCEAGTRVMPDT